MTKVFDFTDCSVIHSKCEYKNYQQLTNAIETRNEANVGSYQQASSGGTLQASVQ